MQLRPMYSALQNMQVILRFKNQGKELYLSKRSFLTFAYRNGTFWHSHVFEIPLKVFLNQFSIQPELRASQEPNARALDWRPFQLESTYSIRHCVYQWRKVDRAHLHVYKYTPISCLTAVSVNAMPWLFLVCTHCNIFQRLVARCQL